MVFGLGIEWLLIGLVVGVGGPMVLYGTVAKNRWGWNRRPLHCPRCGKQPPIESRPDPLGNTCGEVVRVITAGANSINGAEQFVIARSGVRSFPGPSGILGDCGPSLPRAGVFPTIPVCPDAQGAAIGVSKAEFTRKCPDDQKAGDNGWRSQGRRWAHGVPGSAGFRTTWVHSENAMSVVAIGALRSRVRIGPTPGTPTAA
jgi:hypothetical protein